MRHPGVLRYSRLRRSAGYRAGGTWAVHGECLSRRGGEGGVIYVKRTRIAVVVYKTCSRIIKGK